MDIHKLISQVGHEARFRGFHDWWRTLARLEYEPHAALIDRQNEYLQSLVRFSYEHVPYYRSVFDSLGLIPTDIKSVLDLPALPVLTKDTLRKHWGDFVPRSARSERFITNSTGGSTGAPLIYRMSHKDFVLSQVIRHYAYHTMAGYRLGDRMVVVGGSSVLPSGRSWCKQVAIDFIRNERSFSSFHLDRRQFSAIHDTLERARRCFLRGYPSSIFLAARALEDAGRRVRRKPRAIFTTAEVLFPFQREMIEDALQAKVFDCYGVNDGGVSAYECEKHDGLHIDMVRAVLELVDDSGRPAIPGETGRVLATSLHNTAMPFIRYDTGDLGILEEDGCGCGRHTPRLRSIVGRTGDYLEFYNGRIIAPPILTILFGRYPILQYQVVQKSSSSVVINIVKDKGFMRGHEELIRSAFLAHIGELDIRFNYLPTIERTDSKWKFIVSEVCKSEVGREPPDDGEWGGQE